MNAAANSLSTAAPVINLERGLTKLCDFKIEHGEIATRKDRLPGVIKLGDRELKASRRFYTSLLSRFGIGDSVFQYFTGEELFRRITEVRGNDDLRFTIEHPAEKGELPRLLAVAGATTELPDVAGLLQLFGDRAAQQMEYVDGILTGRFMPRTQVQGLIGPDEFQNRFAMEVPLDGYGKPSTYLEMLRLVCLNGAIGRSTAFRQMVNPGKDAMNTMGRLLRTFDSQGFTEFRERFAAAQLSPLSVREAQMLRNMMAKFPVGLHLLRTHRLEKLTGDFGAMYGLSSASQLSAKRQALLPANCRVYDAINLCSELATHFATGREAQAYHAFMGTLLSQEYDLEGTAPKLDKFPQYVIPERAKLLQEGDQIERLAEALEEQYVAHGHHVLVDGSDATELLATA